MAYIDWVIKILRRTGCIWLLKLSVWWTKNKESADLRQLTHLFTIGSKEPDMDLNFKCWLEKLYIAQQWVEMSVYHQKKNILCAKVWQEFVKKCVYMCPPTSPTCHLFGIWQQLYLAKKKKIQQSTIPTTSRENVWQWQIENSWHILCPEPRVVNVRSLLYDNDFWFASTIGELFIHIVILLCTFTPYLLLLLCVTASGSIYENKRIKRCLAI